MTGLNPAKGCLDHDERPGCSGSRGRGWFSDAHMDLVHRRLRHAESLIELFYRFSPREWFHYSYSVHTARDIPRQFRRTGKVLAEVVRSSSGRGRVSLPGGTEYGILLYDPRILAQTSRRPGLCLERFLTCILAHELVHIARFSHSADYDTPNHLRDEEETRVRALTLRVLSESGDPELMSIAKSYMSHELSG